LAVRYNIPMPDIYVSIASYMDEELYQTVHSLFSNAENPQRIFVAVFSQDDDHPDLQTIFDEFNIKEFIYEKVEREEARGVGYARNQAQKHLSEKYKYYLQVDSHTIFDKKWDTHMTTYYEMMHEYWGKCIISHYPHPYDYNDDGTITLIRNSVPTVKIIESDNDIFKFEAKYTDYLGDIYGQETGYFCAGEAFGYSKYFLENPYDPYIYFQGEEQTFSLRFFEKGIKVITPQKCLIFHHYNGHKRKRHWESNDDWTFYEDISKARLADFFNFDIEDNYGLSNKQTIKHFYERFVTKE